MSKVNIKGGTPVGAASLCRTCTWAHIMSGYRESEMVVICTDVTPNIVVPFTVHECSCHNDRNRPTWSQMEKLAINVSSPVRLGRPVGFGITASDPDEDEACEEEDALIAD